MSAASAATLSPLVNVSAFIMLHGGVRPIPLPIPLQKSKKAEEEKKEEKYQLTGGVLPQNIRLFAPAILGNWYYDTTDSDKFIHEIHKTYVKPTIPQLPYIDYCLDQIRKFEEEHVAMCGIQMAASGAMKHQDETKAREGRLLMSDTIAHKSCVEWREHTHFIEQKTYSIHHGDNPPNSIMFFCQQGGIPLLIHQGFKDRFDGITGTYKFDTGEAGNIHFKCACDLPSRICSIQFTNKRRDVSLIPFQTIHQLLSDLVSDVLVISRDKIHISMFDFTCSKMIFPGDYSVRGNFTPEFISSNQMDNTLVYGTYDVERARRLDHDKSGEFPWAQAGSPSPEPVDAKLRVRPYETGSMIPGGAAATVPSVSPGVPPTPILTVHLSPDVVSFVDFKSKFKGALASVSPVISSQKRPAIELVDLLGLGQPGRPGPPPPPRPLEVDGGSHRTHTRSHRSRRHPRVGKKVSLRHRRRRLTKARSRRHTRKRETKN